MKFSSLRPGFTLLELPAVLILVGLVAGVAAVSLLGPYRAARQAAFLAELPALDGRVRRHAERFGRPGRLRFRFEPPAIGFDADGSDALGTNSAEPTWRAFPAGCRLTCVGKAGEIHRSGEIEIEIDGRGVSPTYGWCLQGPDGRTATGLTLGLTGQFETGEDARAWEAWFAAARLDVD